MADFIGTAGDDQLLGSAGDDVMEGGAGKDRLKGGDGNDVVDGGEGNDYVYGDAGNDKLYGGLGNDTLVGDAGDDEMHGEDGNDGMFGGGGHDRMYGGEGTDTMFGDGGDDVMQGGAGNDKLYGGTGNDRLEGGEGDDLLDGGSGNDTLVYRVGSGTDTLLGNTGIDTLELVLSGADLAAVRQDIADFADWLEQQLGAAGGQSAHGAQASGPSFTFGSLGMSVSGVEAFNLMLDGAPVSLDDVLNAAPVVDAVQEISTTEDAAIAGQVSASDPDGDPLAWIVHEAPANGSVVVDQATGAFSYAPSESFSGSDVFKVMVTDPDGASALQEIRVGVEAVADAPVLSIVDPAPVSAGAMLTGTPGADALNGTAGDDVIHGGAGDDVILGDGPGAYRVALDISAALTDADGSESLSVTISGVPAGATLSAGVDQGDGSWRLAGEDLAGLTLELTSPESLTLSVTATATEANGAQASVTRDLAVVFENGAGNDIIAGGAGNDVMDGGAGFDLVDMSDAPVGSVVDLSMGSAIGDGIDKIVNFECAIGSPFGDVLVGSDVGNVFYDGAGNDKVYGAGGDDTLVAGSGNDLYDGGDGFDIVDFSEASGPVDVDLGSGRARGGSGSDRLVSIEGVVGSAFDDELEGDKGNDLLAAGEGDDVLRGGRGADILTGGAGADTFVFEKSDVVSGKTHYGVDTITDFGVGDRLDFSKLVNGSIKSLADAVRVTETAEGTLLTLDTGSGAGFVDVVLLEGVFDLDLEFLDGNGQIIV